MSMGTRLHRPAAGGLIHGRQSRRDPAAGAERQLGSSSGGQLSNADGLRKEPILAVEKQGDACVVKLAGELDLYNAPQVRGALTDACADSPNRIVVDLSEVEFIDSTALGVLIEARTQLDNRRAFLLAAPGLETKRALEISGLDRHFTVHNSGSEGLLAKGRSEAQAMRAVACVSSFSSRLISVSAATIAANPKNASAQNA